MRGLLLAIAVYAALLGLMVASVKIPFLARHDGDLSYLFGLIGGWLLCDGWRDRNKTRPRSAVERVMADQAKALRPARRALWLKLRRRR
jgi:hypothetical protein